MKRLRAATGLLTFLAVLAAAPATIPPAAHLPWKEVKSWGYQLQNYDLETLIRSRFDLLVIDPSKDGSSGFWTKEEIERVRNGTGRKKRVVAYLSIGEAEDYRPYWKKEWKTGEPAWLEKENPDWKGNFRVRFWMKEWQDVILGKPDASLDRLLAQDFDGVYLDIVDAYSYPYAKGRKADMVAFVKRIADYARAKSPLGKDFAVFPQNAEELCDEPGYLAAVNGIGKEETWFLATDKATKKQDRKWTEENLDKFKTAGPWGFGLVLAIDYADKPANVEFCYKRAREKGYIPYVTVRALDRLRINPSDPKIAEPPAPPPPPSK